MNFNNKVVWITGASSGIGKALALKLASNGARLILSSRNENALKALKNECHNADLHFVLPLDLTDIKALASKTEEAWALNRCIDVLVNNGGVSQRSFALDTPESVDRLVMEVDYFGTITLTKCVVRKMLEKGEGKIVTIASLAGKIGSPMRSAYSGAKHAVLGFMNSLRAELSGSGVRIVNVCPGFVQTDISKNALTGEMEKYGKMDKDIAGGMPVEKFVKVLLEKLNSSKDEIMIVEGLPRFGYLVSRLFPNFFYWLLPKLYQRED